MARLDPHSFYDTDHPRIERLTLDARVDFTEHHLEATVLLHLTPSPDGMPGKSLVLDTRGLDIAHVRDGAGRTLLWQLATEQPILGSPLTIELHPETSEVSIEYKTGPAATALQWLSPEQTSGKQAPFLFSQCQAIHARSIVPLQDTPQVRIRYEASLNVPNQLRSLMAARFDRREVLPNGRARDHWTMPQSIPPYLLAFAVGDLACQSLSERTAVWSEPCDLARTAWEFANVERYMQAAEQLFGPYDWERFDLLLMPPSFPYGGMENPRLTFLTPTLLASDRSLVSVVAHELAHSWTGNLVSNASAEHFWLNEGFTVYAERRILEAVEGKEVAELSAADGARELAETLAELSATPELTQLRTHLADIDPDESFSVVPYEKGYLLLCALERAVGREKWDNWLRHYLRTFRFRSLTTEQFVEFLSQQLPEALAQVDLDAYLHKPGLPSDAPTPSSARLDFVRSLPPRVPTAAQGEKLTAIEWKLYLDHMPRPTPRDVCEVLDSVFALTQEGNAEVLSAWLRLAIESRYDEVLPQLEQFLAVGRMKFLKPLYGALMNRPELRERARTIYQRHEAGYHPIARQVIATLLSS